MKLKSLIFSCAVLSAGTAFSQDTQWSDYYSANVLTLRVRYADCHYPERGVDNRYLLISMTNGSEESVEVSYDVNRSYNGKALDSDVKGHTLTLAAGETIEASCEDLRPGLHIFAKTIGIEAKSVLSDFAFTNLTINGKPIAQ